MCDRGPHSWRRALWGCHDPAHGRPADKEAILPTSRYGRSCGVEVTEAGRQVASVVSAGYLACLLREQACAGQQGVIVFMLLFCFVGPHFYVTRRPISSFTSVGQVSPPSSHISWGLTPTGYDTWAGSWWAVPRAGDRFVGSGDRHHIRGFLRAISGYAGGAVDAS